MQLTPCPIMEPPKLMELPKRCNGRRVIDYGDKWEGRNGPDVKIVCTKCGATFKLEER